MSRLASLIAARVYDHSLLEEIQKYASVPVVNALSDLHNPTKALADLMTIYEHFGYLKGLNVAWVGDGNNILSSLLIACTKMKMNFASSTPIGYAPCVQTLSYAEKMADINGTKVTVTTEPEVAVRGADVVITDTWISMRQEAEKKKRLEAFEGSAFFFLFSTFRALILKIYLDSLGSEKFKNFLFRDKFC